MVKINKGLEETCMEIRKNLKESNPIFPYGMCHNAAMELKSYGFIPVSVMHIDGAKITAHFVAYHPELDYYLDLTSDQFPEFNRPILAFKKEHKPRSYEFID